MSHPPRLRHAARRLSLAGLLLALAPLTACTPQVTVLSARAASPEFHTITVIGRGEVSARPDLAQATLGVEVIAPTVAEATSQAASRMNQIMAALKRLGIAEADIRTSNFSVHREQRPDHGMPMPMMMPEMAPPPAGAAPRGAPQSMPAPPMLHAPRPMGEAYRVSNTVEVKIRDLARVGAVLDAAIAAGANHIWGVQFTLDKTDALEAQAREKAAADARSRAEAHARLQGVTLAGVISIDERAGGGMPYPMPMAQYAMREGSPGTPTSPGEVTFATQVQVVYGLQGDAAAPATTR